MLRRILLVASVAGCLLSLASGHAQAPRPMTVDDVLAVRNVSDTRISPDGRWVAYVVTTTDLDANETNDDLWRVATSGDAAPLQLTNHAKSDNRPRWSPDGQWLAFISARDEHAQIYLLPTPGGEPRRLTGSKTGVTDFAWAPDGRRIAYLAPQEPTKEEEEKKERKDDVQLVDREFKYRRLWAIDVASGDASEVVSGDFQIADPQWSPDGSAIAYVTTPTPKADDGGLADVWIVDVATKSRRALLENEGPDQAPRWSPDGTRIALLSRDGAKGHLGQLRLLVVPAEGGAPTDVAPDFLYQPRPVQWVSNDRLFFTAGTRTTSQLYAVAASGGEPVAVSRVDGVIDDESFSSDGGIVAFTLTDVTRPADVHVSRSVEPLDPRKLTDHNPEVRELALGRSETITWKSRDGLEIEGLVLYPPDYQAGRRYPLIVHVHGGPSGVYSNAFPRSWANYGHVWAGGGWVVLYPNPRGSSGYGERFLLANVRDWGGGDYRDIQAGVDHLVASGVADPDRMGQLGWSYGGYMTAWTLTQTDRFKAVMVGAGLTNMFSMYSTNDLQRVLEGYFGAEPWDDTEIYWERSAMNFIKQAKTPTLIMHGAADDRVPLGQAQELYMGLKKNEVDVEMAVYPREPHGLREPRHQLDKMQRELAWFTRHVLGATQTPTAGERGSGARSGTGPRR